MDSDQDYIINMTKSYVQLYLKIKKGAATEREQLILDQFTYNYLDYVYNTGSFYVSGRYVSPSGYALGSICAKYKERYNKGLLKEKTVAKVDALGFFWGKKNAWISTMDNITPIRHEIIRSLGIEQKVKDNENVIYTYVINNVSYSTLREIKHKGTLNCFWQKFWDHYVDYVETAHSSFIPADYTCEDGFELGEISKNLRREYEKKTMHCNVYDWLDSIGFGWNEYSSNLEILKHNVGNTKKRLNLGRERVINQFIDRVNVDNFCLHYLHYVAGTDTYDTPVDYVCQDGYLLGQKAQAYQKLYEIGALPSTTIKCLNVLGFPLPEVQIEQNDADTQIHARQI